MNLPVYELANAQEITVRINDGKLSEAPWFVFKSIHSWDAGARQADSRARLIEAFYIQDSDVAAS
ncbi:MAG: hypothetical protein IPJ07_24035 [Acidobacteria bacterium]|nr:hypothetical protein [Acidobacteriota bacterium]